jgi:hypothetical protein
MSRPGDWAGLERGDTMEVPDIQFAKSRDVNIAYQRCWTGPGVLSKDVDRRATEPPPGT